MSWSAGTFYTNNTVTVLRRDRLALLISAECFHGPFCTFSIRMNWIHHRLQVIITIYTWLLFIFTHVVECFFVCLFLNELGKKKQGCVKELLFSPLVWPTCTIFFCRRNSATQLGTGLSGCKATHKNFTAPERCKKAIKYQRTRRSKGSRRKTSPTVAAQHQSCRLS